MFSGRTGVKTALAARRTDSYDQHNGEHRNGAPQSKQAPEGTAQMAGRGDAGHDRVRRMRAQAKGKEHARRAATREANDHRA